MHKYKLSKKPRKIKIGLKMEELHKLTKIEYQQN